MDRLLVFADIHGSLSAWLTARSLLSRGDGLVVAGDLFDTRYGNYGNPDFCPDQIRSDLKTLDHPLYYVYGNCDVEAYCPGYAHEDIFSAFGRTIALHHGHRVPSKGSARTEIIIQGHTHLPHLEKQGGTIFMNPGSIAAPRNQTPSYGIIDPEGSRLVELKTGNDLVSIPFT